MDWLTDWLIDWSIDGWYNMGKYIEDTTWVSIHSLAVQNAKLSYTFNQSDIQYHSYHNTLVSITLNINISHKSSQTIICESFWDCMFLIISNSIHMKKAPVDFHPYQVMKCHLEWWCLTQPCLHNLCLYNLVQFEGILPKGPYPPCLRMADRAFWQDTLEFIQHHTVFGSKAPQTWPSLAMSSGSWLQAVPNFGVLLV